MTSRLGPPRCFVRTPAYLRERRRLHNRRHRFRSGAKRRPAPPVARPTTLVIRGETCIQRCLREAKESVRRRRIFGADCEYGDYHHNMRHRYDLAVHEEFHRNLKRAGVYVEGA